MSARQALLQNLIFIGIDVHKHFFETHQILADCSWLNHQRPSCITSISTTGNFETPQ